MFRPAIALAVAVLVCSSVSGQSADLALTLRLLNQPLIGASAEYALDVANRGPGPATAIEIVWRMPTTNYSYDNRCRPDSLEIVCTVESLEAGASLTFRAGLSLPARTSLTTTARAHAAEEDPDGGNNTATLTHDVIDPSKDLSLTVTPPDRLDERNRGLYHVGVSNRSSLDAMDPSLTFSVDPRNARIVDSSPPLACEAFPGHTVCRPGALAAGESREYAVTIEHPTREGHYTMAVILDWLPDRFSGATVRLAITLYRPFVVTSVADDGPGSLRQAIWDVNKQCARDGVPCLIAFAGPMTIAPSSALPMVLGPEFLIDGAGSTITGDAVRDGEGLFIAADQITIRNLQVSGFGRNGVLLVPLNPGASRREMTIIAFAATGNGLRGLMAYGLNGTIRGSVFSRNDRSGLFIVSSYGLGISGNRIEGNGASGIYVGPNVFSAVIADNTIVGNGDFGVAVGTPTTGVQVLVNTILSNGRAIDIGLDGPTEENAPPLILAAYYDVASGDTIINGVSGRPALATRYEVLLYASRSLDRYGFGQAETYLGTADAGRDGRFAFTDHGDLRGQFVSGVTIRTVDFGDFISHQTSEFGPPATVR